MIAVISLLKTVICQLSYPLRSCKMIASGLKLNPPTGNIFYIIHAVEFPSYLIKTYSIPVAFLRRVESYALDGP